MKTDLLDRVFDIDSIGGDKLSSPLTCRVRYSDMSLNYVAKFIGDPIGIQLMTFAESPEDAVTSFRLTVEDTFSDIMSYPEEFQEQFKKIKDLLGNN